MKSVAIAPGATKLNPVEFVHYPISHSLLAVCGWSVLLGVIYYAVRRSAVPGRQDEILERRQVLVETVEGRLQAFYVRDGNHGVSRDA